MSNETVTGWWCPHHLAYVAKEHVTLAGLHDPLRGGCGGQVVQAPKPTTEQAMAGYAVACRFGVLEARAFALMDQMFHAFAAAGVAPTGENHD